MTDPRSPSVGEDPTPRPPVAERFKVAFFTDSFEPTHDGVAKVTSTLAGALADLGHEVTVFTVRGPTLGRSDRRSDGVVVRRCFSLPAPRYPQYRIALPAWSDLFFGRAPFDVVHVHTPGFVGLAGWLASRRWNVPAVGTYHTNLTDMLKGSGRTPAARAFFRAWSRFSVDLCAWCDLATAPTDTALGPLVAPAGRHRHLPPRRVPNGVDTERFRPGVHLPNWRARLGADGVPLVAFVGRLTRSKGVSRFLEAMARLDPSLPARAVVAGEGPLRSEVSERITTDPALRGRVAFVGAVPEVEKPALLSQADLFVLPSTADTSSVALLEAMASGCPCVVSREGGPGEIARISATGLLVDPEDPVELTGAIEHLLRDPSKGRRWSTTGRSWVERNASAAEMARRFSDCYRAVLDQANSGGTAR